VDHTRGSYTSLCIITQHTYVLPLVNLVTCFCTACLYSSSSSNTLRTVGREKKEETEEEGVAVVVVDDSARPLLVECATDQSSAISTCFFCVMLVLLLEPPSPSILISIGSIVSLLERLVIFAEMDSLKDILKLVPPWRDRALELQRGRIKSIQQAPVCLFSSRLLGKRQYKCNRFHRDTQT
jgi:hypothetical protein